ncbi:hypothetical protein EJF36_14180 [Bacillus sp. HMF5848]|uniref:anti-sigma factor family protein n=1 Tax=Bacillus sp. HMF5848 TaxID=2495421 RepID=UPI000F78B973|nr:zf-HC2 domain-containing protein [Bacillus sp. HMF5848]RSK27937.1 hypothetical protein EJF36_14180 [Bacillus sp. HMF5848]
MNCHDIGELQAYLDGELSRDTKKHIMKHLEGCAACRHTLEELQQIDVLLKEKVELDIDAAWQSFQGKLEEPPLQSQKRKGWFYMKKTTRRWLITSAATVTIFSSFAFPQVQAAANQFLSLFRVDQLEMVKLTQDDVQEIENWVRDNEAGTMDIKGIGKIEMEESTGDQTFYDTKEAAEEAGYDVSTLSDFDITGVHVMPASTLTFTLDVEKTNKLLQQLGSESKFEETLDGEAFSVRTFDTVRTDYIKGNETVSYILTQSPEISVPNEVSIVELRSTLLSLPFLPENVKQQIASIDDIESTLPIPYVEEEGKTVNDVTVAGNAGIAVEADQYRHLVWQENESIHILQSHSDVTIQELIDLGLQLSK